MPGAVSGHFPLRRIHTALILSGGKMGRAECKCKGLNWPLISIQSAPDGLCMVICKGKVKCHEPCQLGPSTLMVQQ